MSAEEQSFDIELSTLDGAVELWTAIGGALREAGYGDAGPEYLRLSRLLQQAHNAALLDPPVAEAEKWATLRHAAMTAYELLGPLAEAAATLAKLPSDGTAVAAPGTSPTKAGSKKSAKSASKQRVRSGTAKTSERRKSAPVRTVRPTKSVKARSRAETEK